MFFPHIKEEMIPFWDKKEIFWYHPLAVRKYAFDFTPTEKCIHTGYVLHIWFEQDLRFFSCTFLLHTTTFAQFLQIWRRSLSL